MNCWDRVKTQKKNIWSISGTAKESSKTDETRQAERGIGQVNKRCCTEAWEWDTVSKEGFWGCRNECRRR